VTRHHTLGGAGAVDLAKAVVAATQRPTDFKFLYDVELPIKARRLHFLCLFCFSHALAPAAPPPRCSRNTPGAARPRRPPKERKPASLSS
jgi:hypothetical protein